MNGSAGETTNLLRLLREGHDQARSELIKYACERLRRLASRMLKDYPGVARWEETGDVLNKSLWRLHEALAEVPLESSRHFWNLAALQLRRELLDLAQHHLGPQGHGAKHHSNGGVAADDHGGVLTNQPDSMDEPDSLDTWSRFHEAVGALPEEEQEVTNLIWYEAMNQKEVASVLGVSLRTVKRLWQSARRLLVKALSGDLPR